MKSIINAINNLAQSINNLASSMTKKSPSYTINAQTTSSTPSSSFSKLKYYPSPYSNSRTLGKVTISKQEYDAFKAVYKAVVDAGSYPHYHSRVSKDLKIKWPVLSKALDDVVDAYENNNEKHKLYREKGGNPVNKNIWKEKEI